MPHGIGIDATVLSQDIEQWARRFPYLGPGCWMLTVQYFVAQIAAAVVTGSDYNWGSDPISYLGITQCGMFSGDYVCSPLYMVFNLSLIGLGVAVAAGAFSLYHQFNKSRGTRFGFSAIALAALGTMLVGIFPASTLYAVHSFAAGLVFISGLIGVFTLSISLRGLPLGLRYAMAGCGSIALTGLVALAIAFFLPGIGFKAVAERMVSYPVVLSLIGVGGYMLIRKLAGRAPWAEA